MGIVHAVLYFTDHEADLGRAISVGRREEFKTFAAFSTPAAATAIPDPQSRDTFERSRLQWDERDGETAQRVLALYRELLALRRTDRVFAQASRERLHAEVQGDLLVVRQWLEEDERLLLVNFGAAAIAVDGALAEGLHPAFSSRGARDADTVPACTAILYSGTRIRGSGRPTCSATS